MAKKESTNKPRLKERYDSEIVPAMMADFGIKNRMAVPAIKKISINVGVGKIAVTDSKAIEQVVNNQDQLMLTWQNLIQPLEDARFDLEEKVNIISHLHSVQDNLELRKVYSNILPKLSDLTADLLQNNQLQQKVLQLKESASFVELNIAQQKLLVQKKLCVGNSCSCFVDPVLFQFCESKSERSSYF